MLRQSYTLADTHFAYCYRVFLRCHTHRRVRLPTLAALDTAQLAALSAPYNIQILESSTENTDLMLQASLRPEETVSACASKLKGQISKHLRKNAAPDQPTKLLGRGYFACTSGKSTQNAVLAYLGKQGTHHGYAQRVIPPVHQETFPLSDTRAAALNPTHAMTCLQFHIVLATWHRRGVFGSKSGPAVSQQWKRMEDTERFALLKVSFVPDHVHIAVRIHAGVSPGELAVKMMNAAQELMLDQFREHLIQAGLDQLWQPSAYLGSYGDVTSKTVTGYMRKLAVAQQPNNPRGKPGGFSAPGSPASSSTT
jgi:REP element-mobilizing transposase RayT